MFFGLLSVLIVSYVHEIYSNTNIKPNIVVILVDDVGWNDFSYNSNHSLIRTTNIDRISSNGIRFKKHYVQSVCTPTRASLLTGRYAANVGLVYAMVPGTPTGIPHDIPTLPQLLRNEGYHTAMVGKWHLGHSQWAQTPVGKGFQEHIGSYMWDLDSYTKQQYELPFNPLVIDWVHAHENGSYVHYAEPRHATEAITDNAVNIINKHASSDNSDPLFLYVAYTAAHSPLQPMPHHYEMCSHIPHLWRRQFCGMVMGLDEGINNITESIRNKLGENTLLYVFSDNGGSTWFGGLNTPLRGGKSTPHEGGVRVPAFMVDFTKNQKYLGLTTNHNKVIGREYHGLMHISDILPTLMGYAGVKNIHSIVSRLDGYDFGDYLRSGDNISPRSEMLVELYDSDDFIFDESLTSYIWNNDMKLIQGIVRDPHMHYESTLDRMNCTDSTMVTWLGELGIRALEWIFGAGKFDNTRIVITHRLLHMLILQPQKSGIEPTVRLYNITSDPTESNNIATQYPEIVSLLQQKINDVRAHRPLQQKFWLQYDLSSYWPKTFVSGDCSMNKGIRAEDCKFTHPWLPDDIDPWRDEAILVDSVAYVDGLAQWVIRRVVALLLVCLIALYICMTRVSPFGAAKKTQSKKKKSA